MDEENKPIEAIDISQMPDLIGVTKQVRKAGHPVSLRVGGQEVGVLVPAKAESAPRREDVLRIIAEHRAEIEALGVRSIALFGSVARDEAKPESDVDVLVEVNRPFGYFQLFELEEYLVRILGRTVDLFTPDSLRKEIRAEVMKEAVRAA